MIKKKTINDIINDYNIPIKEVKIGGGLIGKASKIIDGLGFGGKNILLVGDQNTSKILDDIFENLDNNFCFKLILKDPYADEANASFIYGKCRDIDLLIAVGSGTINDLCKITSFRKNIPYLVFATAPSMNGYTSSNASILVDGHKESFLAHQALAIYFDLSIICSAPIDLIKAGIGDSLCYYTCYFDWLLSSLVTGTYFNDEVFDILDPYQKELIDYEGKITDKEFIKLLCEILIISGLSMYICKGSYPASQGEHMIAHFLEMTQHQAMKGSFHGIQIAITTLTMIDVQERLLKKDTFELKDYNITKEYLRNLFDGNEKIVSQCLKYIQNKKPSKIMIEDANKKFQQIKKKLLYRVISKNKMLMIYDKFDLPLNLKISSDLYQKAVDNSYLIRDRLTSLDFKT